MTPKITIYNERGLVVNNSVDCPVGAIETELAALCLTRRYDIEKIDVYLKGKNGNNSGNK
jgi:hypothetical protein